MHPGSIHTDTAAGRLYHTLRERRGIWCDAWWLSNVVQTTALSTRVSEVRRQLPPDLALEHKRERGGDGKWKQYYRITARQIALFEPKEASG